MAYTFKIFIFLLFQLISCNVFSQISQVSIKVGLNYSTVHNENLIRNKFLIGTEVGAGLRFNMNKEKADNLFLQLEILSSNRGYKQLYKEEEISIDFYYLSFPITAVLKPTDFLSIEAGIEHNFLIQARWFDGRERIKVLENYERNDWGLVGGMTFLENQRINFFFRYVYGLKNILHYPLIDKFGNIESQIKDFNNRSIQFGVIFNIEIDK